MQTNILKPSRLKKIYSCSVLKYSNHEVYQELLKKKTTDYDEILDSKVRNVKNKILYSDYLERKKFKSGYTQNIKLKKNLQFRLDKEKLHHEQNTVNYSIALKYLQDENLDSSEKAKTEVASDNETGEIELHEEEKQPIYMPYAATDKYEKKSTKVFEHMDDDALQLLDEKFRKLYEKYVEVQRLSNSNSTTASAEEFKLRLEDDCSSVPSTWMTDYEVYDDSRLENIGDADQIKYGTPDPNAKVSSIPCGGCGALLHCQDPAIPGYLPSELFKDIDDNDLKSITCQRCHFMKHYGTCLDVRVHPDEYPQLLEQIKDNRRALVILLVDLTDFPCSIWPQLPALIGTKRTVFVIGNKVDLLPVDGPKFLDQVKDSLTESLIQMGIVASRIKHIGLVSAKTGFGIEQMINKLHVIWNYKTDIYLVGCTNSGKSTLFNHLLQSDLCKSQAVDLVQRATTSPWPGTTLNLLKFPILKPSNFRLYARTQRLREAQLYSDLENRLNEEQFKKTRNIELLTLQSRIDHTFKKDLELQQALGKSTGAITPDLGKPKKFGLDEEAVEYKSSRWFYDTPGVIQPDQILHFLTTDELLKTLPKRTISPRTFCIWPGKSIFIAGLGRLDILDLPSSYIRCTVFASLVLPVTICNTEDADMIYKELLHSEAFVVPSNNVDRLKMWPELKSKDLETVGIGVRESVSDVVLSSAGWIAITAEEESKVIMRAWTPGGRGIYLRTPPVLPFSVNLRGMRRVNSPAYQLGRQVYTRKSQ